jgi:hypothetical protein
LAFNSSSVSFMFPFSSHTNPSDIHWDCVKRVLKWIWHRNGVKIINYNLPRSCCLSLKTSFGLHDSSSPVQ